MPLRPAALDREAERLAADEIGDLRVPGSS
jgi:hypothetical protein